MAELSNTMAATAWGSVHAYLAPTGVDGALPLVSAWEDLGAIDEDALSIETTEGTVYQLKDINGKLLDELTQEPEITVNFTLLKPADSTKGKFWEVVEKDGKLWVKSMVKPDAQAFMFANPAAIGSQTFEAPVAKVNMQPGYAAAKGFNNPCKAKILNTGKDGWFAFGTVSAPTGG